MFQCAHISAEEEMDVLGRLGRVCLSQGLTVGKIAYEIAEETGVIYRRVKERLPDKFKARLGLRDRSNALEFDKSKEETHKSKVAHLATVDDKLLSFRSARKKS